jgi:hypothetical protein
VAGRHIRVAVVDSVLSAPDDLNVITEPERDYVAGEKRDTTGHGTKILGQLSLVAPDATFKTYRVIASDEEFRPSNFLKAMSEIAEANVDVVNISAGKFHSDCGTECRICMAAEDVVSTGCVVCAGAGNRKPDRELGLFCPAKSVKAVAVGTSETLCTASTGNGGDSLIKGASIDPPGSYWVKRSNPDPFYPNDNYCGYGNCSPFHECGEYQETVYWDGNAAWRAYTPEVVAPGHTVIQNEDTGEIALETGTSYSCAMVSGGIATVLSELLPDQPSQRRINNAVRATSRDLDCGPVGKFSTERPKGVLS